MLSIFNKLLSKIPGNGYKSFIGLILTACGYLWSDFPREELGDVSGLAQKIVEISGHVFLIVGILHKFIKAKLKW
jgi:hypothetical protein